MTHPFLALPTPLVIGHRGCAGEMPENTLASFERGLADGAVVIESDVHLTRDGVPVLIHDDRVDRVTEGRGPVRELDLAGIQKLDAAYHFSPDGGPSRPERGRGHRIPSLLEAFRALPDVRLNLELKEDVPGLVEETLALVRREGRAERTLLTAADDALMARLRERVAETATPVALGACTGEVARFALSAVRGEAPPPGPVALQIPEAFAGRPLVTPALVDHAHAHGVQVHVWTIDETEDMRRLLALGVDGLVTDYPARMVALLRERR